MYIYIYLYGKSALALYSPVQGVFPIATEGTNVQDVAHVHHLHQAADRVLHVVLSRHQQWRHFVIIRCHVHFNYIGDLNEHKMQM